MTLSASSANISTKPEDIDQKAYEACLKEVSSRLQKVAYDEKQIPILLENIKAVLSGKSPKAGFLEHLTAGLKYVKAIIKDALGEGSRAGRASCTELDAALAAIRKLLVPKAEEIKKPSEEELKREQALFEEQKQLSHNAHFKSLLSKIHREVAKNADHASPLLFFSHAWPLDNDPLCDEPIEDFSLRLADHLTQAGFRPPLLDKEKSGTGNDLYRFMYGGINEADHVLIFCTRTMQYKFERQHTLEREPGERGGLGIWDEHLQIKGNLTQKGNRYVMPICFSREDIRPGIVSKYVALLFCREGYIKGLLDIVHRAYGLGKAFWQTLVLTEEERQLPGVEKFLKEVAGIFPQLKPTDAVLEANRVLSPVVTVSAPPIAPVPPATVLASSLSGANITGNSESGGNMVALNIGDSKGTAHITVSRAGGDMYAISCSSDPAAIQMTLQAIMARSAGSPGFSLPASSSAVNSQNASPAKKM